MQGVNKALQEAHILARTGEGVPTGIGELPVGFFLRREKIIDSVGLLVALVW
jgi:hypothetical protein